MLDIFTSKSRKVKMAQKARTKHFSLTSSSSIVDGVIDCDIVVNVTISSDLNRLVK